MCNTLHSKSEEIEPKGRGWKVFRQLKDGRYMQLMEINDRYHRKNGWVEWDDMRFAFRGEGFCFFLDKQTAEDCADIYSKDCLSKIVWGFRKKYVVKEIEYERGMGKHVEGAMGNFYHNYEYYTPTIALCKRFRIIPDRKRRC
jgi:hypothetical protein